MFAALLITTGITVSLPSTVEVMGTELTIGAIAQVSGEDADLVARVEAMSLGYAPAPGFSRLLDQRRVAQDLQRMLPSVTIQLSGASHCRVTPSVVTISAAMLLEEAGGTMREAFGSADTRITAGRNVSDVLVPRGKESLQLRAALRERTPRAGAWSVPVEILIDGAVYRTVWTTWNVEVWARRQVLNRDVRAGESLSEADFDLVRVPLGPGPLTQALEPGALSHAKARRALAKGEVVTDRDLQRAVVIKQGDTIGIQVRRGQVTVRALAVALRDARIGDRLPVRVQKTGKEFNAVVTGPESVELRLK